MLFIGMQWDYGKISRGESAEKRWFFENLILLVNRVEVFWIDDFMDKKEILQGTVLKVAEEVNPDLIMFIPYVD